MKFGNKLDLLFWIVIGTAVVSIAIGVLPALLGTGIPTPRFYVGFVEIAAAFAIRNGYGAIRIAYGVYALIGTLLGLALVAVLAGRGEMSVLVVLLLPLAAAYLCAAWLALFSREVRVEGAVAAERRKRRQAASVDDYSPSLEREPSGPAADEPRD